MAILERCASGTPLIWATADPHGALKGQWGERLDTHLQSVHTNGTALSKLDPAIRDSPVGQADLGNVKNLLAGGLLGQPAVGYHLPDLLNFWGRLRARQSSY